MSNNIDQRTLTGVGDDVGHVPPSLMMLSMHGIGIVASLQLPLFVVHHEQVREGCNALLTH